MIAGDHDGNLFERQVFPGNVLRRPLPGLGLMAGIYAPPPFRERFFGDVYPARTGLSMAGKWPAAHDPYNADATPDYDAWGWDDYWGCIDWEIWHGSLKAKYGKQKADYTWIQAWDNSGAFAGNLSCRSLDSRFRTFLKKEGLMDAAFSGLAAWLARPIGAGTDVVSTGSDTTSTVVKKGGEAVEEVAEQAKEAAKNVAQAASFLTSPLGLALVVGGVALVGVYLLRKSPQVQAARALVG